MADYQIELGTKLDTRGIDTAINKYRGNPIEIKSKLDTTDIDKKITSYKAKKPIEVDVKLNTTGIAKKIGEYKVKTPIKLNAKLDTKSINSALSNYEAKPLKLKVETNFNGVATQITNYSKNAQPIKLRAELNKSAVSNAINEFNNKINAAESKTKIKIKVEPDLKGIDEKIGTYEVRSPLRVKVKINKTDINNQIKQYDDSDHYVTVKAKLDNGAINQAIKDYKTNTPIKVDLELDHTDIDNKVKSYAAKGGVLVPARLVPSKSYDSYITKTPIKINAELNPEGINSVIEKFKPTSKIKVSVKLEPKDINAQISKLTKPTEPINVDVGLDEKSINTSISLFKPTAKIKIKPDLILEDVDKQIGAYVPKTELKVNVNIDKGDIDAGLKGQSKQTPITVNVQLNREKLNEQIKSFKATSKIAVGIKLDPKGIAEQIKKIQPKTKIKVGVQIDPNDVAHQVGNVDNNTPIKLGVELDKNSLQNVQSQIDNVRKQVEAIGNVKIQLGGNAGSSGAGTGGTRVAGITRDFVEADIKITEMEDHIGSLKSALSNLGFDQAAIDVITKDFEELDVVVKNVTTRLDRNGDLSLNIKGIDSLGRAVTMIKRVNKDGSLTSLGSSVSQSFKETEASFKRLKQIASQMKSLKVTRAGLDTDKDKDKIAELTVQIDKLKAEYRDLYLITQQNLDTSQLDELNRKSVETGNAIRVARAAMSDKAAYNAEQREIKETRDEYQKLIKIADSMKRIKVTLAGLDPEKDKQRIAELTAQLKNLQTEYKDSYTASKGKFDTNQLDALKQKSIETAKAVREVKSAMADDSANKAASIRQGNFAGYDAQIAKLKQSMKTLSVESADVKIGIENVENALKKMRSAADDKSLIEAENEFQAELKETLALLNRRHAEEDTDLYGDTFEVKKAAALERLNGLFEEGSQASKRFGADAQKLRTELDQVGNVKGIDNVNRKIGALEKRIKSSTAQTQTWGTRIKEQFSKYSQYLSVASVFMYATQAARDMFEQVKLIDSAMTELKKVTDETDASYNKFLKNAASRSKELGTTIDGLVASTADFARLGYGFEDAQGLAEVANIYAVVGDEIEGVEGATESLISTMAAFKDDMTGMSNTDIAMSIIDTYNELGNKFAISSGGLGEALERSASSLAAANNTLHESAALITAANEVVQNPEKVGTAFKTISMRIKIHCPR